MSLNRPWIAAAGALVSLTLGPGIVQWSRLRLTQWHLDRQLAHLSAERQQLLEEQQRLQSDPAYVEGLIRSTFKVSRPGEYVVPLDDAVGKKH